MSQKQEEILEIMEAISQSLQNTQNLKTKQNQTLEAQKSQKQENAVENLSLYQPQAIQKLIQKKTPKQASKKTKKLVMYRCKICKTTGKKSTVKMCSQCKFHFHKECLDPERIEDQSKVLVCQICQKIKQDSQRDKINAKLNATKAFQHKKEDVNWQKQKQNCGFLNISKLMNLYRTNFKKEEWKRKLFQFYKKYPYCFHNNKVVFPIQDHLLHIYQSIFPSYCKTTTPRPKPISIDQNIPKQLYNDLFQIQVFFSNYWQQLKSANFFKPQGKGQLFTPELQDTKRTNLYHKFLPQGMNQTFCQIFQLLLRIYLKDTLDRNRIDNMKYISSSAFFNLLAAINQVSGGLGRQFVIKISPEIIRNLVKIPSFRHSFLCGFSGKDQNQPHFPKQFTCKNKIELIIRLVRGLTDTECFKQIVMKKSQQIGLFTKQKGEIVSQLKSIQAENLALKQRIKVIQKQTKHLALSDPKQYSRKYQTTTKYTQKLSIQRKHNQQTISQLKEKIKDIAKRIPFVNNLVRFLGVDRFKSEYFFYRNQRDKVYVNYRESLFSGDSHQSFMCYQSKGQVQQLKGWLNPKGVNQRDLFSNLNSLEQKQILSFSPEESNNAQQPIYCQQQRFEQLQSIRREENLNDLIQCQRLFKQTVRDKQTLQIRQQFMVQIISQLGRQSSGIANKAQIQGQNIWKILFSKYPNKVWSWNEKAKKYWIQFLDLYVNDSHYNSQCNLMILVNVWKIAMTIYHSQTVRKREKMQKKRQKQRIQRQKEMQSFIQQHQLAASSQEQNQEKLKDSVNGKRLLRKRQHLSSNQKQQSQEQQLNSSSKRSSSNQEQSSKAQSRQKRATKQSQKQVSDKLRKSQKNKLQIQSDQQEQNSEQQQESSQRNQKKYNGRMIINYERQLTPDEEISPEQQFCEQCFENIYYEKSSKIRIVRCLDCQKIYHKKCLQEQDSIRYKKDPNQWKCLQCYNSSNLITMKKIIASNLETKKKIIKQKQNKTIAQSISGKKYGQVKSKANQKVEKKQRKKGSEQQRKIEESSQNTPQQEFEQVKVQQNGRKKMGRPRKITKQPVNNKINNDQKIDKIHKKSQKRLPTQLSNSQTISSAQRHRITRKKSNKKRIIEQQSPSSEQQQPNSEQQNQEQIF